MSGHDPAVAAGDIDTRVRLGASADTAPDLLLRLARDSAVTVRAAVAMNRAAPGEINRLLAADRDERVRTLLARKLAELIPSMPDSDRAQLQGEALAILAALVEDAAVRVRAAIADAVKDMPAVPRALILRLAYDRALAVSGPVIRLSPLLTAEDLLALLASPPCAATTAAVADRPGLHETVADAIAGGSDAAAITALLSNPTAAIRESTLDALVERADAHLEWHLPLVRRPRLSARATRALSELVAAQLLDELLGRGDLEPDLAAELRRRLDAMLAAPAPPAHGEPDMEEAMGEARHLLALDGLDEAALLGAAERGEVRMATALLAVAADVPASVVERAATLRSAKGLVSLVWKAGFPMRVAVPLQVLLARLAPGALLRPGKSDGFPLAVEEMRWQIDFLTKMGR